jgi:dimethyladenosine transferase
MIDTRTALRKFNIKPTKALGQNFLKDDSVIKRIVESAEIKENDLVIEIGPGLGSMTVELAARAGKVVAVEIDRHLIPVLQENIKDYSNVVIIQKDILKVDIKKEIPEIQDFIENKKGDCGVKVVANLPYYITTPVIMKLLEQELPISEMVFMVQAEVADRMAAEPGGKEYGALSVAVQYYSKPETLFNVSPECFIPQPGVESTVIKLNIYKVPPVHVENKELFFKTVKAAFGQRRKTLVNALYNSGYFTKSKEEIKEILYTMHIGESQRGETLTIMQFAQLANSF